MLSKGVQWGKVITLYKYRNSKRNYRNLKLNSNQIQTLKYNRIEIKTKKSWKQEKKVCLDSKKVSLNKTVKKPV